MATGKAATQRKVFMFLPDAQGDPRPQAGAVGTPAAGVVPEASATGACRSGGFISTSIHSAKRTR